MQFIHPPGSSSIEWSKYRAYLEGVRDRIPAEIYKFASDSRYFGLDSPQSLHDSWFISLCIYENRALSAPTNPEVRAYLRLLGREGDRTIVLEYSGVSFYHVEGTRNTLNYSDTFHGDLYTHEVRVVESSQIEHEILFRSDSVILIRCATFTHREEPFPAE